MSIEERKAAIWAEVEKVYGLSGGDPSEAGWSMVKSRLDRLNYQLYTHPSDSIQIHLHEALPADDPAWLHASIALGMNWAHKNTEDHES